VISGEIYIILNRLIQYRRLLKKESGNRIEYYKESSQLSSYECGFDKFSDARNKFDVHFYIVAILFIVFDLEIVFLYPWATVLAKLPTSGFCIMLFFLGVLIVGFIYE